MEILLKKVTVDGYKNLIECEADIGELNVLVGPNNSGKSNFLEIFTFVDVLLTESDSTRNLVFETANTPRGDSAISHIEGHTCKPASFSFTFEKIENDFVAEIEYSVTIACKDYLNSIKEITPETLGFLKEELTYKEKNKPGKPSTLVKRIKNKLQVRTKNGNFSNHSISLTTPAFNTVKVLLADSAAFDTAISESIAALLRLIDVSIISASPNEIRECIGRKDIKPFGTYYKTTSFDILPVIEEINSDSLLFNQFRNIVCSILDLENINYSSFEFPKELKTKDSPDKIKWFTLKPHGQPFSYIANFSDGTLMVVALLAVLFSPSRKNNFICIEEPENCLHPKALKTLMTFLKAKSNEFQLLITTHSPSILNQIDPSCVIVARVHEDGGTRFERINNIRELNKTLRKGYISFGDLLETEFKQDEEEIF